MVSLAFDAVSTVNVLQMVLWGFSERQNSNFEDFLKSRFYT